MASSLGIPARVEGADPEFARVMIPEFPERTVARPGMMFINF
jgi:hypothetical protein